MVVYDKKTLYYKHLIIGIYLSAFEMIIRGLLGQIGGLFDMLGIAVVQGWIYVLPIFLMFFYPIRSGKNLKFSRILVFIQILYLILLITPVCISNGPLDLLLKGVKNFYIPLIVYFVIIDYLLANYESFEAKFFSHIVRIGIIFGIFIIIEVSLLYFFPGGSLVSYLRLISFSFKNAAFNIEQGFRPLGLYHSMQYSGLLLAILAIICFYSKHKLLRFKSKHLFYFFTICLLVSTAKTYTFAFIIYMVLTTILSFKVNRYLILVGILAIMAFFMFVINTQLASYYHGTLFGDSKARFRMMDKWSELGWYLKNSILPNGFMPDLEDPQDTNIYIPFEYYDGEVSAYKYAYQLGIFGFLMWFYTVFKPLFTIRRIRNVFLSPYGGVLFVASFGFIHYVSMFPLFIFSIVILSTVILSNKQSSKKDFRVPHGLQIKEQIKHI